MFENVLGHDALVDQLRRTIADRRLPRAVLLAGPRYAGKSTIALEMARSLMCLGDRSWNCRCGSCTRHRALTHPDLALVGGRYFDIEIDAARAAVLREARAGTVFLLIRAVRRLVRRFDAALVSDALVRKVDSAVTSIGQLLDEIEPDGLRSEPWTQLSARALTKTVDSLAAEAHKLVRQLPHDPVPVDMVRMLGSWARLSPSGVARVAIIEEAHTLAEGSRNALLKILEEPPEASWMILTSTRPGAIIPTVASRLRRYAVPSRPLAIERSICERIFRGGTGEDGEGLAAFLRAGAGDDAAPGVAEALAARMLETPLDVMLAGEVRSALQGPGGRQQSAYLLEALAEGVRRRLGSGGRGIGDRLDAHSAMAWNRRIRRCVARIETRNMQPVAAVLDMLIEMGSDARVGVRGPNRQEARA